MGDACAFCSLAHTTPLLGGSVAPAVALLAYAQPFPPVDMNKRAQPAQARCPRARAPPSLA